MDSHFEDNNDPRLGSSAPSAIRDQTEWARLESIGDMHFQAAVYTSALDYYTLLLSRDVLEQLPTLHMAELLRKSIDAGLLLGRSELVNDLIALYELLEANRAPKSPQDEWDIARSVIQGRKAILLRRQGKLTEALTLAQDSLTILSPTDSNQHVARAQNTLGILFYRLGRLDDAELHYRDGLATSRRIGDRMGSTWSLANLGLLKKNACAWSEAESLFKQAINIATELGAGHLLPGYLLNLGIVLLKSDQLDDARTSLEKGLRLAISLGNTLEQSRLQLALGRLNLACGDLTSAQGLAQEGQNLAHRGNFSRELVLAQETLGDIAAANGSNTGAGRYYRRGLRLSQAIASNSDMEGELWRRLAANKLATGYAENAIELAERAIQICLDCGEVYELGFCHEILGKAHLTAGNIKTSAEQYQLAAQTFKSQHLPKQSLRVTLDFVQTHLNHVGEAGLEELMDGLNNLNPELLDQNQTQSLCWVLLLKAQIQAELKQFNPAAGYLAEIDTQANPPSDEKFARQLSQLRAQIKEGLLDGYHRTSKDVQVFAQIPGQAFDGGLGLECQLKTILTTACRQVQADAGFIALSPQTGRLFTAPISARSGLSENLCNQLLDWYTLQSDPNQSAKAWYHSSLKDNDLARVVPAVVDQLGSCVFMPIVAGKTNLGLLFLGRQAKAASNHGFTQATFRFLSTYTGFLALTLIKKGYGAEPHSPINAPSQPNSGALKGFITSDRRMLAILELVGKVAPSDLTVLINGETGTGKGIIARAIHEMSARSTGRFVSVNCAAIPETLLESELFGHKRGSFTGADRDKTGLLASAEGGTVFLDEIGKMPLSMQSKMLQFFDTRTVRPVGTNTAFPVDVRIICAAKTNLRDATLKGDFLEDFYYRLLDFPLTVPPLRDRGDDIRLLAQHFIQHTSRKLDSPAPALSQDGLDILMRHVWDGNVRELEKTINRAMVLAKNEAVLQPEHLPLSMTGPLSGAPNRGPVKPLKQTLADIEANEIGRTLKLVAGNKSHAARILQISYPNLLRKIKRYNVT